MKVTTYEGTVVGGCVILPDDVRIPDKTRVYVVIPPTNDSESVRVMSPRLVHQDEAVDFVMQVEREGDDARV